MPLPSPNLDDRTYEQLLEEAKNLIPKHCPKWTNFNASDPGITLLELMAWMTETILYRLNRVPDKNYIELLNLMGVDLRPAQPAQSVVTFNLQKGKNRAHVDVGTKILTKPTAGLKPKEDLETEGSGTASNPKDLKAVVFETERDLNLTSAKIVKCSSACVNEAGEKIYSHFMPPDPLSSITFPNPKFPTPFAIFQGKKEAEHILYLGGKDLAGLGKSSELIVDAKLLTTRTNSLRLAWEFWNGSEWESMSPEQLENGTVVFRDISEIDATKAEIEVHGIKGYWIRCRFVGIDRLENLPTVGPVLMALATKTDQRVSPESVFYRQDEQQFYVPIDLNQDFYPFGLRPAHDPKDKEDRRTLPHVGDCFYIGHTKVFSQRNSQITVEIELSDNYSPRREEELQELKLCWEYAAGPQNWKLLGTTSARGDVRDTNFDLHDGTKAFTKPGTVTFICPPDMVTVELQGQKNLWVRVRIAAGSYGEGIQKIHAPLLKHIRLGYRQHPRPFEFIKIYNYFEFEDIDPKAAGFEPFKISSENSPALYLGFDQKFNNELQTIYFQIEENNETSNEDKSTAETPVIVWEYCTKKNQQIVWRSLEKANDMTRGFSWPASIEFMGPDDFQVTEHLDMSAYWLRARCAVGVYSRSPQLLGLHMNSVGVIQAEHQQEEVLWSSTGEKYQQFYLSQRPILPEPEPEIWVREMDNPSDQDVEKKQKKLGKEVREEPDKTGEVKRSAKALWMRWHKVENFFNSGPKSRHYTLNYQTGVIRFGDGQHGRIPPQGKKNIRCQKYYMGGGRRGNAGIGTITELVKKIDDVESSVFNFVPAEGGHDAESVEEAKLRGPSVLKHGYRAVTEEDFEALAQEASGRVARVKCVPSAPGEVTVIIVPKGRKSKLLPSAQLCRQVKDYLDQRRLITTKVNVVKPNYVEMPISAKVALMKEYAGRSEELRAKMITKIKDFFHPLRGGPGSKPSGWEFGRNVHVSEVYFLLEDMDEIDYVESASLSEDPDRKEANRIELEENDLVYISKVEIKIVVGSD